MAVNTVTCERCGQAVPRYNVQGIMLCTACYKAYMEMLRQFLNN